MGKIRLSTIVNASIFFPEIARGHGSKHSGVCDKSCNGQSHIAKAKYDHLKLQGREANLVLHMQGER